MENGKTSNLRKKPLSGFRWVILLLIIIFLLELNFSSFMADDFIQLGVLEKVTPCTWLTPFNLYTIADGNPKHMAIMKNTGAFPWFFSPNFKMAFLRPLSSLLLAMDHALFGLKPLGYRLHSLIWFWLLLAGFWFLLRQILPNRLGTLALVVFAISGIHGILCWIATRHIVVAAALGLFGLVCHIRWRENRWQPGRFLSIAGFSLSLMAGEAAIGIFAYLLAYEVFRAAGDWRVRIRAALPVTITILIYFIFYRLLNLGAGNGSEYINPLQEPITFLIQLPGRFIFLIGSMLMGGNADLWVLRPHLREGMIAAGVIVVFIFILVFQTIWKNVSAPERKNVGWLLAGSMASVLPFSGTPIGSRCLVVPFMGGAVIIAFIIQKWWTMLRRKPGLLSRLGSGACAFLALIHLFMAPVQRLASPLLLKRMMFERLATAMNTAEFAREPLASRTVIILTAPDLVIGLHSYFYRALYRLPMPAAWRVLSWAPYTHRFQRSAMDTLIMELPEGEIHAPFFKMDDVVVLNGMRVTVLVMNKNGPTRVEFRFDRPLDDPLFCFMAWKNGRLRQVKLPLVGEALTLTAETFNPWH
jgi:hypothetical protein